MRPPRKAGGNAVGRFARDAWDDASMRPPRKAGGNLAVRQRGLALPVGFNEAPAKSGGEWRRHLKAIRKEISLQ